MRDFGIFALPLDGWQEKSRWGWDSLRRSLYAQLTRNGRYDDDGPEIWISPPMLPEILDPLHLARYIAETTGVGLSTVHAAMNTSLPGGRHPLRLPDDPHAPSSGPQPYLEDERFFDGLGPYKLVLTDWDEHSVWGYGLGLRSLWARLQSNDTTGASILLSPASSGQITEPVDLVTLIAERTSRPLVAVHAAINHAIDYQGAPEKFRIYFHAV